MLPLGAGDPKLKRAFYFGRAAIPPLLQARRLHRPTLQKLIVV
jgi:hypothetical protein